MINKKEIQILTFSKENSYGALLQCHALSKYLIDKGYKVKLLNIPLEKKKYGFIGNLMNSIRTKIHNKFRKNFLPDYVEMEDIMNSIKVNPKSFDNCTFVVGSDQVWNPSITKSKALSYFFNFLPDNVKRISYAASFGEKEWKHIDLTEGVRTSLEKFANIGVREKSGVDICEKAFQISDAVVTIDPTLLLDNYDHLLNSVSINTTKSNIVAFKLAPSPQWYDLLRFISSEKQKEVVSLADMKSNKGVKNKPFLSVKQWLSHISNSSFVVTDSFHCTVFAILFKKNFIVVPSFPERMDRVIFLLKSLGIESRYYNCIEDVYKSNLWKNDIDFEEVHKKLSGLRETSKLFLHENLK